MVPRSTMTPSTPTSSSGKSSSPPLGPLSTLPEDCAGLKQWKILLLCTAINSFSQRVITYLDYLGFEQVSVQIASSDEAMQEACESWDPDLVICPFLTRVIPGSVFKKWITLVVHPGPPGDAGPSSLDWVLLGDTGSDPSSTSALSTLLSTSSSSWQTKQRSHWGTIVFQANEHLDGGAIWAWEQYPLPPLGTLTKAQLYQSLHSQGAISALIHATIRVYQSTAPLPKDDRVKARPLDTWQSCSVTAGLPFQGGQTHERPLIQAKVRRLDFAVHTAEDVQRIIYFSDSQPGAQLAPLTGDSKTSLFAYGAHLHLDPATIPADLYTMLGYETLEDVPDGRIIAQRDGAVLIKTRQVTPNCPAGVWITHGRVPKKAGTPLEPKVPMVQAIQASGHGSALEGVQEWTQESFEQIPGTWQEVYVKSIVDDSGKIAQCVYWEFYNGACSTRQCQMLLRALQWAVEPERGNVKVLALMGGSYFSNGIALNTIEASSHPGQETWANINAIDDIVEFLVSDTSAERSPFMRYTQPLCERGIVTVACVRANAAAGGVALAAGCDVVIASRGVVLNPAYRAMGLHGSEFHSYSYLTRCGETRAAAMLRDMLPQSSTLSRHTGLVDIELGTSTSSKDEIDSLCDAQLRRLLDSSAMEPVPCAPWSTFSLDFSSPYHPTPNKYTPLTDWMSAAKRESYRHRSTPPLVHFRNEELSQMLLDSFHLVRSKRYHERRYKFIRKVKSDATSSRYVKHRPVERDEEEREEFDDAPGWVRGEEWAWAGLEVPTSLATSEDTRIPLYPIKTIQVTPVVDLQPTSAVAPTPADASLPPGAAAPDAEPASARSSLLPPTMAVSTFSTDTVSFTDDLTPGSTDRASSSEDGTAIITPEPKRSGFFKRHTRGISSTSQFSKTSPAVNIPDADQTISKRTGRFKTFSKRLSGAFTLKRPPAQRPSILPSSTAFAPGRLENVTKSTRASMSILREPPRTISQRAGMSISSPLAPSPKAVYNAPTVEGADVCEFGCLYEPNGVKGLTPGEGVGEMGSGVMRPDNGRAFGVARPAPPPPTHAGTVA